MAKKKQVQTEFKFTTEELKEILIKREEAIEELDEIRQLLEDSLSEVNNVATRINSGQCVATYNLDDIKNAANDAYISLTNL